MAIRNRFGWKMWLLMLLAGAALALGGILLFHGEIVQSVTSPAKRAPSTVELKMIVDSLTRVFVLPTDDVRQRRVFVEKKVQLLPEHRIEVQRNFPTLDFNYQLSRAVARFGATVAGEERSREKKAVLRVLQGEKVLWTVVFALTKKTGGKESTHRR